MEKLNFNEENYSNNKREKLIDLLTDYFEKNINIDFSIKSTHPAPATIRSLSFEGDYSPKFYKTV